MTAAPPFRVRIAAGAMMAAFVALAVWGWFAILREQAPGLALAVDLAGAAGLLAVFLATLVTYSADENGVRRKGVLGARFVGWDEIASYRVLGRRGQLTCILYDRAGKRRVAVSFALLGENGRPLFELLQQRLPELLPDQPTEWPPFAYRRSESAEATRSRAYRLALLALAVLVGIAGYLGATSGPAAWRDLQLARRGRTTSGSVWAVLADGTDRGVMYEFNDAEGERVSGAVWLSREDYRRIVGGPQVRVRYLPYQPTGNVLESVLKERWPREMAALAAITACLLSAAMILIWVLRKRQSAKPV